MSRTRIAITPGRPSQPAAFSRSWLLPAAPTAGRGRLSSVAGAAVLNAHGDDRGTVDGGVSAVIAAITAARR
jgi:hypothetical protein